jgi:simple sugar transport system ATP-binding protein
LLVVSEELDELFEICDRICVMARGRLSPAKPARATNAEEIGLLMGGSFIGEPAPAQPEPSFVDTRSGVSR